VTSPTTTAANRVRSPERGATGPSGGGAAVGKPPPGRSTVAVGTPGAPTTGAPVAKPKPPPPAAEGGHDEAAPAGGGGGGANDPAKAKMKDKLAFFATKIHLNPAAPGGGLVKMVQTKHTTHEEKKEKRAKALFDSESESATEHMLAFKENDIARVISQEEEWWFVELHGKEGYVPANYFEVIADEAAPHDTPPPAVAAPEAAHEAPSKHEDAPPPAAAPAVSSKPPPPAHVDNSGKIQEEIDEPDAEFAVAQFDFDDSQAPEGSTPLSVKEGDIVKIEVGGEAEWWYVSRNGVSGYIPSNYVELRK